MPPSETLTGLIENHHETVQRLKKICPELDAEEKSTSNTVLLSIQHILQLFKKQLMKWKQVHSQLNECVRECEQEAAKLVEKEQSRMQSLFLNSKTSQIMLEPQVFFSSPNLLGILRVQEQIESTNSTTFEHCTRISRLTTLFQT